MHRRSLAVALSTVLAAAAISVLATPAVGAAPPLVLVPTTTADTLDAVDGLLSLREAVDLANDHDGDSRIELAAAATYALTRCDGVPADGGNESGDLDYTVASVSSDTVTLEVVTPVGSPATVRQDCPAASGERAIEGTSLRLDTVTVTGGRVVGDGGGVKGNRVTLGPGAVVSGNTATGDGGGVAAPAVYGSQVTLAGRVEDNHADGSGGGVSGYRVDLGGVVVRGNDAGVDGGGIAAAVLSDADLSDPVESTVEANHAAERGGGIFAGSSDPYGPLAHTAIVANSATDGGGLWVTYLTLGYGVRIAGNAASRDGGGVHGLLQRDNCVDDVVRIEGNVAAGGSGGGWFVPGPPGALGGSVCRVRVEGNTALAGGGVAVGGLPTSDVEAFVVLDMSAVLANHAVNGTFVAPVSPGDVAGRGGGVLTNPGGIALVNTTISENTATVRGGGLGAAHPGTGSHGIFISATISSNAAPSGANLSTEGPGDIAVSNTVFADPIGGANCASSMSLVTSVPSYADDASCALDGSAPSTNGGTDPLLGPLTTPDPDAQVPYRVPALDSPLRGGAGPAVADTDARGVARPQGPQPDIGAVEMAEPTYHPVAPARVVDTRSGLGAPKARIGAGGVLDVDLTGVAGIPPTGVTAVAVNVTAVAPTDDTHLTVWPTGTPRPTASTLNTAAGRTLAAATIARLSADGRVSIRNNAGTVDVIVDVVGWYDDATVPGAAQVAVPLTRLLDTRTRIGTPTTTPLPPGGELALQVTGRASIPAGADAVVLNLTGVSPTGATHLTVWEDGTPRPAVSNLNLAPGDTTANLAVVALSDDGRVRIRNSAGATHVLADVVGYLDTATTDPDRSGHHPRPPVRVLDTRAAADPLAAGEVRPLAVTAPSVGGVDPPPRRRSRRDRHRGLAHREPRPPGLGPRRTRAVDEQPQHRRRRDPGEPRGHPHRSRREGRPPRLQWLGPRRGGRRRLPRLRSEPGSSTLRRVPGPTDVAADLLAAAGLDPAAAERLTVTGPSEVLPSVYPVTTAAAASVGAALVAASLVTDARDVGLDTRHVAAAFRSERHLAVDGRPPADPWDPIAGSLPGRRRRMGAAAHELPPPPTCRGRVARAAPRCHPRRGRRRARGVGRAGRRGRRERRRRVCQPHAHEGRVARPPAGRGDRRPAGARGRAGR